MKNLMIGVALFAATACSTAQVAPPGPAAPAAKAKPGHTYAVVFEITLDGQGKFVDLKVAKVIDPASGSTDAVDVPVPDALIARLREKYKDDAYEVGRQQVYSYEFFTSGSS